MDEESIRSVLALVAYAPRIRAISIMSWGGGVHFTSAELDVGCDKSTRLRKSCHYNVESSKGAMIFDAIYSQLGWPKRKDVLHPPGSGPGRFAELVRRKIQSPLQRTNRSVTLRTGVLTAEPSGLTSDAPLAIVGEFDSAPNPSTLSEFHRLAWSFCHSPLLITLEPGLLRAWNCCEKPPDDYGFGLILSADLLLAEHRFGGTQPDLSLQTAKTLHWVSLITGDFLRRKEAEGHLNVERRADRMLLDNLKFIRQRLLEMKVDGHSLSQDTCHDLLARVIFIQFLCERKDSEGNTALGSKQFASLHKKGRLSQPYQTFQSILQNHNDTYALFRFLDGHFNGDLFPGKGLPHSQRRAAWLNEMKEVQPAHLNELAKLLDGRLQAENNQLCLWRHYSFDAIPLEFISSIYEEFVTKRKQGHTENAPTKPTRGKEGVVYTPGHLVDFILDRVLGWQNTRWDIKILDPSCGSGIFLVKAFQRLMHRWRLANPGVQMQPKFPRRLLERNLAGVDIDNDAVRVASFSLYLAMLDELDPKLYFRRTKFPSLYRRRLIPADFFNDAWTGIRDHALRGHKFDLVLGNAPWGEDMMTPLAAEWAKKNDWPVADKNIGPLFISKALAHTKPTGCVALLAPAGALLVNFNSPEFRRRLFSEFKLESIINFSALSRVLFERAASPCVLATLRPIPPDENPFYYCSPKRQQTIGDKYQIILEPHDGHWVYQHEIQGTDEIWSALIWGGRRELRLIQSVAVGESLSSLRSRRHVFVREGFIRGDRKKAQFSLKNRRILENDDFPHQTFLHLAATKLSTTTDFMVHSRDSTNFRAFDLPQLIIKSSWTKGTPRFRAVSVESTPATGGVICKQSFVSVSAAEGYESYLEAACLLFNSKFAVFRLLLTSGRFAFYRTEPLVSDLLTLSLPPTQPAVLEGLKSFEDVDSRVCKLFSLEKAEAAMVEDLCSYTLPDYRGDVSSPGYQKTSRLLRPHSAHPGMADYCDSFIDVVRAGFGDEKRTCATIYLEQKESAHLPVRLVAVHLDWPGQPVIRSEVMANDQLLHRLSEWSHINDEKNFRCGRTARIYSFIHDGARRIPTVFLIKPDQQRFWTRSEALRDADSVAGDIMAWRSAGGAKK